MLCVFTVAPLSIYMMSKVMKRKCETFKLSSTMYERLNKQVKFLTSQYIGTCKSAYTKGYALN